MENFDPHQYGKLIEDQIGSFDPHQFAKPIDSDGIPQSGISMLPGMEVPTEEDIKRGASAALPFLAPEVKALPVISKLLAKIPGATSVGNALGRIGYGTALSTIPDLMNDKSHENLRNSLVKNLGWNTAIEAA